MVCLSYHESAAINALMLIEVSAKSARTDRNKKGTVEHEEMNRNKKVSIELRFYLYLVEID